MAPGFQVSNVSGTLWRGRVEYSQWLQKGQILPLGQLDWRLIPRTLMLLQPCADFSARAPGQRIETRVCYSLFSGKLVLSDIQATLPMEVVTSLFVIELDGTVKLSSPRTEWTGAALAKSEFNVLWQEASIYDGSQWTELGTIRGEGADDGAGGLTSSWKNTENSPPPPIPLIDLQLRLSKLSSSKPDLHLTGTVDPRSSDSPVASMLKLAGEPLANGAFKIDIKE